MDANTRLRIATRIHFALLHRLGEGIDVGHMLKNEAEAREVIRPHISNLRRKLEKAGQDPDLIVNVRGIGYRLSEPVS